jgi:polysaccharide export outer membrane protein
MRCIWTLGSKLFGLVSIFPLLLPVQFISAQTSASHEGDVHSNGQASAQFSLMTASSNESSRQKGILSSSTPLIGPGDEVEVTVYGAPDVSVHNRVAADGCISVPLIGHVRIAGLSSAQAEGAIGEELRRQNVLNSPQVSVYVKEYGSSGISVAGEVVRPGVYPALGPHRLFDILQEAGGRTEKAADSAVISHHYSDIPVTIDLPKDPERLSRVNIELIPGDTVVVPKAGIVYVLGGVNKPGGYVLSSDAGLTVLRVIAAAGGPTQTSAVGRTKILRRTSNGLQEISVPLQKLLHAKAADIPVQTDDIIYLPSSRMKEIVNAGTLISTAGTAAIYRLP